jgi:ferritin
MQLSSDLNDALVSQCIIEYSNQMAYKQIEDWFETQSLHRIARWFHEQANKEKSDSSEIQNYLYARIGGDAAIAKAGKIVIEDLNITNVSDVADKMLALEQADTEAFETIYGMALDEKSYVDLPFLAHMLKGQVDDESQAMTYGNDLRNAKDLVLFDKMTKVKKS